MDVSPKQSWLRDPLLHFVLIGAALFGIGALAKRSGPAPATKRIEITRGDLEQMRSTWQMLWHRPPTQEELERLIDERVREEVFSREAIAMGLDRDDIIIRRRLAQKLEFLMEDVAVARVPTDEVLATFLAQHGERYAKPARLSFSHIFFSSDRRGTAVESGARAALARLRDGTAGDDTTELGDPFLLEANVANRTADEVTQMFGREFSQSVLAFEPGAWQGPVASGYGWHLVKVLARTAAEPAMLDQVRDQLVKDWKDEQRRKTNRETYERLRAGYEVTVQEPQAEASPANVSQGRSP
jgi:hypothetical protein